MFYYINSCLKGRLINGDIANNCYKAIESCSIRFAFIYFCDMKLYPIRQLIFAWLLLFTIAPIGIVKTFHTHKLENTSNDTKHANDNDACNCSICHFELLPFIETSNSQFAVHLPVVYFEPVSYSYKVSSMTSQSPSLRAPPSFI
jgi:hypothetical protein